MYIFPSQRESTRTHHGRRPNVHAHSIPSRSVANLLHSMVASAVIVPDPIDQPVSPPLTSKRRQSSVSDSGSKRLRLSHNETSRHDDAQTSSTTASKPPPPAKEANVQVEERKRGKRLFGALLGTLAQSSSSTAQRRRVDIEQKQQAKLKLQDEEYDEKKKLRLDALREVRRREQKKYNKQSVGAVHDVELIFDWLTWTLDANQAFQPLSHGELSPDKVGAEARKTYLLIRVT